MSYENLLVDRCDIYLLKSKDKSVGYGINNQEKEFYYDTVPDYSEVPCYFTNSTSNITQGEPAAAVYESFKVHFKKGTDIHVNSIIVKDNIKYKLQIPRNIRNHHIEVIAIREEYL